MKLKFCYVLIIFISESSSGVSDSMSYVGLIYYEIKGVQDSVTFTAAKKLNALIEVMTDHHVQY